MTFLTIGEPLTCLASASARLDDTSVLAKSVAGAECNVAIGLARLGHRSALVGRVGGDPLGREVLRCLRGEGVDVSHLVVDEHRQTGLVLKEGVAADRVDVFYYRSQSAGSALDPSDVPDDLTGVEHVHVTGITLVLGDGPRKATEHLMRRAREEGARVSLDANFRLKLASAAELVETFESAAALADDVLLGWGEAVQCAGTDDHDGVLSYARGLGRDTVVVKRPGGGVTAVTATQTLHEQRVEVPVVDPVGAGDGFAVGYIHERLLGRPLADALRTGAHVAGRVVGCHGDYQGLPHLDELGSTGPAHHGVTR